MKATIVIAASLTIFFGTPAAASQNQVVNGGFETGNFDGWDQVGDILSDNIISAHQISYKISR